MKFRYLFVLLIALIMIIIISPFVVIKARADIGSPDYPQVPLDDHSSFFPLVLSGGTQIIPTETPNPTQPPPGPTPTPLPIPEGMILVDHRHIDLFEHIPAQYLEAARNTRMLFSDRSVGFNINEGLDCFPHAEYDDSAPGCRIEYIEKEGTTWESKIYLQDDFENNLVPETIYFDPDPIKYDRSNWTFEYRQGTWDELTRDFVLGLVPSYVNSKDVLSYQFSYLNILEGDTIADPEVGFFAADPGNTNRWDISDLEALEAQHPDKIFIYWTTSLARSIGTLEGENFNNQMRDYAINNNKILFDVADIESHAPNGQPCYDQRDGVPFCGVNGCEDDPDDGMDIPAICQDYTSEINGGHLGRVSGGKIRIAKAFWVLMARIAGWDGNIAQ